MTASKAAAMIRIMHDKRQGSPQFVTWITERITRGEKN